MVGATGNNLRVEKTFHPNSDCGQCSSCTIASVSLRFFQRTLREAWRLRFRRPKKIQAYPGVTGTFSRNGWMV